MAASSSPAITIFAWGNESRGDDAIGSILARKIINLDNPAINIVEDHQLNIEHVIDMAAEVPTLFIDASVAVETDYALEKLKPFPDDSISTHSVSPVALLNLFEQIVGKTAPDAYMLHVRGTSFELGEGISASTSESVKKAWQFLDDLFARPQETWGATLNTASSKINGV